MVQFLVRRHWIRPVPYVVQPMVLNAARRAPGAKSGMPSPSTMGKTVRMIPSTRFSLSVMVLICPPPNEPDILARLFLELVDKGGDVT